MGIEAIRSAIEGAIDYLAQHPGEASYTDSVIEGAIDYLA
jgi:hypothetical protein